MSYYTRDLAAGTVYAFEVIAIGRDGGRSSPSRIEVRTDGDGSSTPPAASGPAAPDGLRAELYSARSGELFWRRPDTFGLRYEVRRDGAVLATTDGVSYYDDTLSAGRRYVYEIVAIDRDGRRSRASLVALETGGTNGGNTAVITADNAGELFDAVIDVITGRDYVSDVLSVRDLPAENGFRANGVEDDIGDRVSAPQRIVCDNGGTVDFSGRSSLRGASGDYAFDGCQLDAALFDGRLVFALSVGGNSSSELSGDDLTIALENGEIAVGGTLFLGGFRAGGGRFGFSGDLDYPLDDGRLVMDDASLSLYCFPLDPTRLSGTLSLTSDATGGNTVRVDTTAAFEENRELGVFGQGRMTLSAADGSTATIEVENGDEGSYDVSVTSEGRSDTFTRSLDALQQRVTSGSVPNC